SVERNVRPSPPPAFCVQPFLPLFHEGGRRGLGRGGISFLDSPSLRLLSGSLPARASRRENEKNAHLNPRFMGREQAGLRLRLWGMANSLAVSQQPDRVWPGQLLAFQCRGDHRRSRWPPSPRRNLVR